MAFPPGTTKLPHCLAPQGCTSDTPLCPKFTQKSDLISSSSPAIHKCPTHPCHAYVVYHSIAHTIHTLRFRTVPLLIRTITPSHIARTRKAYAAHVVLTVPGANVSCTACDGPLIQCHPLKVLLHVKRCLVALCLPLLCPAIQKDPLFIVPFPCRAVRGLLMQRGGQRTPPGPCSMRPKTDKGEME